MIRFSELGPIVAAGFIGGIVVFIGYGIGLPIYVAAAAGSMVAIGLYLRAIRGKG